MGGNSSRYVTPPWSPHPLCRDEIRGGHEPTISAPPPKAPPDADRVETYARAICRVYVEESARVMRIKVTEAWITSRVDSRWREYVGQALAAIVLADADRTAAERAHVGALTMILIVGMGAGDRVAAAEAREADLRRERNALVVAMAGSVVGDGEGAAAGPAPIGEAA